MTLEDKIKETITTIALHYKFEIIDKFESGAGSDIREIELKFPSETNITKEDLELILKDIKDVTYHIVIFSNMAAILVEIYEPHIS